METTLRRQVARLPQDDQPGVSGRRREESVVRARLRTLPGLTDRRSLAIIVRRLATRMWLWLFPETYKRAYRDAVARSGAIKIADRPERYFRLRNGSLSPVYVDHGSLLCRPETNRLLVKSLGREIAVLAGFRPVVLANVDSKSSPHLVGAIATERKYRQIVVVPEAVHKAEQGLNLRARLPGDLREDDRIVIVDDVLTPSDTTALRAIELIRRELEEALGTIRASKVQYSLVVGCIREPDKVLRSFQDTGITVRWLASLDEVLDAKRRFESSRRDLAPPAVPPSTPPPTARPQPG